MGFHLSGTVNVPAEEFWEWVVGFVKTESMFPPEDVYLNPSVGDLVCKAENGEKVSIELTVFWEFVAKYHPPLRPAEWQYGVPRLTNHDLEIDFVANTETIAGCVISEFTEVPAQWKHKVGDIYIWVGK